MINNSGFNYYENSGYRNDRKKTITLILDIDDGDSNKPLTSGGDFTLNLFEPLLIDKKSTVYLDSFLTYNSNLSNTTNDSAFSLKINEFNVQSICGNRTIGSDKNDNISGRILIPNENDSLSNYYSTVQHKAKKFNYVCDINPCKLTKITGNIKNINGDPCFSGSDKNNNKIIGFFNIQANWSKEFDRDDNNQKVIINEIQFKVNTASSFKSHTLTTPAEVISDSPMNSSVVLLSISTHDYNAIFEDSSVSLKTYIEDITQINFVQDSNTTTLYGNDKFFIKKDQGFKLISEFVIVSE